MTDTMRGWILANLFVLCIGVLSIVYAVAVEAGAHVGAFITLSMLFSGAALVLWTGWDASARAIATAPLTWVVGGAYVAMEGSYFSILATIPPTEAALLVRLSVPVSLAIGYVILARRPKPRAWIGSLVIAAGVFALIGGLDLATQWPGILFGLGCALFVNVRSFASELHAHNRAARTVVDKLRVTGVIVLVTGVCLTVGAWAVILLTEAGVLPTVPLLPDAADFLHPATLFLALFVGAALFTAMNYFQFTAVVLIGTENFIAITVLIPVAVALIQWLAQAMGWITAPAFNWSLVPVILIVIAGTFMVVRAGRPTAVGGN